MKKLRSLILIMVCITLTLTNIPYMEEHPIQPLEHYDEMCKND